MRFVLLLRLANLSRVGDQNDIYFLNNVYILKEPFKESKIAFETKGIIITICTFFYSFPNLKSIIKSIKP